MKPEQSYQWFSKYNERHFWFYILLAIAGIISAFWFLIIGIRIYAIDSMMATIFLLIFVVFMLGASILNLMANSYKTLDKIDRISKRR
jgi:hypothetical protein